MSKSIRPSNRVRVSGEATGRVLATGKRKQGGAWVRTYRVQFSGSDAVRTVRGQFVRPGF